MAIRSGLFVLILFLPLVEEWLESKAVYDPDDPSTYNNAEHHFMSSKGGHCSLYFRAFGLVEQGAWCHRSVPEQ